jgi:hypothetical protein
METATLQLQQNKLCIIGALNFVTVVNLWRESLPKCWRIFAAGMGEVCQTVG